MTEYKMTISRSYSRKKNLGNYETEDHWAMYSVELPAETDEAKQMRISDELFKKAVGDVNAEMPDEDGLDEKVFADVLVRLASGGAMTVEEMESMSPSQKTRLGDFGRAQNRLKYKQENEAKRVKI
jgi:hypothetical protein